MVKIHYNCNNCNTYSYTIVLSIMLYWWISQANKYGCHIVNIGYTVSMLQRHIWALCIYAKQLICMWGMHVQICHIWQHWLQPCNKEHCTYILHILLKEYGCQNPNVGHMGNMLDGHTHIYVAGHTGMLGGLVGSPTKVAIYPAYAICCKRLWSMPALILGLSGIRWWTTQLTYKQLKL